MPTLSTPEENALYLCDDNTGLPELVAKELGISELDAKKLLEGLRKKGLVKMEFQGKWWWYVSTPLGSAHLKKRGQAHLRRPLRPARLADQ